MRSFLILPISAILLGGCLTSQENPNYEYSTTYKGDLAGQNQYAAAEQVAAPTVQSVSYDSPEARRIMGESPITNVQQPVSVQSASVQQASTAFPAAATAPTDAFYGARAVSGTPGFMAFQNTQQATTLQAAAPTLPPAEIVTAAPIGAAGTPIEYDYSRNIITVDAVTTGQQLPESVRVLQGAGQNYTVQQGDTVYGLARKTCVGVNVIQSMNGLNSDFAINIGQSLRLPASVC